MGIKMSKRNPQFIWIHFTDTELFRYSPEYYDSLEDALKDLNKDMDQIAKHNKKKPHQVLLICRTQMERRIEELFWEGGEDDPEEGQAADNIESCRNDASGTVVES